MNELTGAFLIGIEKNENPVITRQSLANAGYEIKEIEEAFNEARQIMQSNYSKQQIEKNPKKNYLWKIILILLLLTIFTGAIYFFWDKIIGLF